MRLCATLQIRWRTDFRQNSTRRLFSQKKSNQPNHIHSPLDHYVVKNVGLITNITFNNRKSYHRELLAETEKLKYDQHWTPVSFRDKFACSLARFLRRIADMCFRSRYLHRAVVLETIAGVPGMVAGMVRHLRSLRRLQPEPWVMTLLEEAENERMHLMTWLEVCQPTPLQRLFIIVAQGGFFASFWMLYVLSPKLAHRFVGYLEEEACGSYTRMLQDIDAGVITNQAAPDLAKKYWNLPDDATLRDVVIVIRADESVHRDLNHTFSEQSSR
eukprot:TRINITY_DN21542_c0_g1_i1.p1 TRINITY_DN21542_c0_g1~~TRINITY_DN21542_c0_g1_i1.p1  ORF type:complete len:272 (+),score=11.73 TRINITY_DN21542_c0_g1_i1:81-896(+)